MSLNFINNGFIILKQLLTYKEAQSYYKVAYHGVKQSAAKLNIPFDQYMYCTGRWASPSMITDAIPPSIDQLILTTLENDLQSKFILKKKNIIGKCKFLREEVPFHQDISYSYNSPYSLSVWLALNDVNNDCGPLQLIPGSHEWKIEPAVDFWDRDFTDIKRISYLNSIIDIPLQAGDAIIFDSRLWHGSKKMNSSSNRFAYVTRWLNIEENFPYIAEPCMAEFGMWNADKVTYEILYNKLQILQNNLSKNLASTASSENHYYALLESWKEFLLTGRLPINVNAAINDLDNLKILKKAYIQDNAGDLTGKVYRNLWNSLLKFIINL